MNKINLTILIISLIIQLQLQLQPVSANDATGFTIMSIDSVPIISNNNDLNDANFTLTLIANGGGQSVVGNFGNDTFNKILTNLIVKYPLKIEIGNIKEYVTYPILNQGQLYKYEYETKDIKNPCNFTFCIPYYTTNVFDFFSSYGKMIVIKRTPVGMYAAFGNPDTSWNGEIV